MFLLVFESQIDQHVAKECKVKKNIQVKKPSQNLKDCDKMRVTSDRKTWQPNVARVKLGVVGDLYASEKPGWSTWGREK